MNRWLKLWILVLVASWSGSVFAREEFLPLTETRNISIKVPDGFSYKAGANARGALGIVLTNEKENINLTVTFEPDPEGQYQAERSRKERLHGEFSNYVEGSKENAMQFAELEPKFGAATYCIFTDAKLIGKPPAEFPPGEYLNLTVGVKAWPGIVATFTLFSNDTSSASYDALMKSLRESIHEKPAPLL
jgi:hypothetical protein